MEENDVEVAAPTASHAKASGRETLLEFFARLGLGDIELPERDPADTVRDIDL